MRYDPNLIVTIDNRNDVIAFLTTCGQAEPSLMVASTVELANLYHRFGPAHSATDTQRATSEAILATIAAMPKGAFPDEELVRYLARDEAQKIIAGSPPRRIEIVAPNGTTTIIDGPVHYRTELIVRTAAIDNALMLVGPAGCGKTTIAHHTSKALQLPFFITSTINDTHELLGFVDGHGKYHDTPFRNAYEHGGVWVADEIDAWDAAALLAANSALANGFCAFPDRAEPIARHNDFRMIATANTFGTGADRVYVGRNELDAASLDRFATIEVDYDLDLERMFANGADRWLERVWDVRKVVNEKRIRHVVSSRAIIKGVNALNAGITWVDCEAMYLFKGMSSKDREKIDHG